MVEQDGVASDFDDWAERSWRILIPGLSETRARQILKLIQGSGLADEAGLADPAYIYSPTMDRATAEWLAVALSEQAAEVEDWYSDSRVVITPTFARESMHAIKSDLDEFLAARPDD